MASSDNLLTLESQKCKSTYKVVVLMLDDPGQVEDKELESVAMSSGNLIDGGCECFGLCLGIFEFYKTSQSGSIGR